mgnify:FL=1
MKRYFCMTRHEARAIVFTLIFESFFRGDESAEEIYAYESAARGLSGNGYIRTTFLGSQNNAEELDALIASSAQNWSIGRMSAKAILRLALYEMLYTDIPPKVSINEAVELAKEYSDAEEASFVNGILNRIAKEKGVITTEICAEAPISDGE